MALIDEAIAQATNPQQQDTGWYESLRDWARNIQGYGGPPDVSAYSMPLTSTRAQRLQQAGQENKEEQAESLQIQKNMQKWYDQELEKQKRGAMTVEGPEGIGELEGNWQHRYNEYEATYNQLVEQLNALDDKLENKSISQDYYDRAQQAALPLMNRINAVKNRLQQERLNAVKRQLDAYRGKYGI